MELKLFSKRRITYFHKRKVSQSDLRAMNFRNIDNFQIRFDNKN